MKWRAVVVWSMLGTGLGAGCWRPEQAPPAPRPEPVATPAAQPPPREPVPRRYSISERPESLADVMIALREFRDRMCQCKDHACASDVSQQMDAWTSLAADIGERVTREMTEPDKREYSVIVDELIKCTTTAVGGAPPPAPAPVP